MKFRVGRAFPSSGAEERDPMGDFSYATVEQARVRAYREGLRDGLVLTFEAILGIPPKQVPDAGVWDGPLPDDLREWIEHSLERAKAQ